MSDFFTEASRLAMLLVIATTAWRGVATCQAEEKPLAVFVCAGQSNMVGQHGLDSELEAELATMPDKVFVFDGKQ